MTLALLVVLLAGSCWLFADQLLDRLARPYLEKVVSQQLQADVQLEKLLWSDRGIEFHQLRVVKATHYTVELPLAWFNFKLSSLWNRRLAAVQLKEPQVHIFLAKTPDRKPGIFSSLQGLPPLDTSNLPITIDSIDIENAQVLLSQGKQTWLLHRLHFSGSLHRNSVFQLSALFGPGTTHPVAFQGTAEIAPRQTLTLNKVSWQNQQLLSAPLTLALSDAAVSVSDSRLRLDRFDRKQLQELLEVTVRDKPIPASLDFSLSDISIGFALNKQNPILNLEVSEALINWDQFKSKVSDISMKFFQREDGWEIEGQLLGPENSKAFLTGIADDDADVSGTLRLDMPKPDQLKSVLVGGSPLPLAGGLKLTAEYSWQKDGLRATISFQGYAAATQAPSLLLLEHLKGSGKLNQAQDKQYLSLQLDLKDQRFLTASGTPREIDFELQFTDRQQVDKLIAQDVQKIFPKQFKNIKARGHLFINNRGLNGIIETTAEQLSMTNLTLNKLTGKHHLNYSSDRIELTDTVTRAEMKEGEEISAELNLSGSGVYSGDKIQFSVRQFELSQFNYLAADEQTGIGNASFSLVGNISGVSPWSSLGLNLSGTVAIKEILVGNFYADLSPYKGKLALAGQLNPNTKNLLAETFSFNLPEVGSFTASGSINPQQLSLHADIKLTDLATSYAGHLGPLLDNRYPGLEELSLKGQLALAASLEWTPNDWQSSGELYLQNLDAYWPGSRLGMVAGHGKIPFSITTKQAASKLSNTPEKSGHLSFDSLGIGPAALEPGKIQLSATPNRFNLKTPLILQLAGGKVRAENLSLGFTSGQSHGTVDIDISAVDLQRLTEELDLPVMQGRLNANLGRLRYQDRQLHIDGLANIEVFGGRFQIRNMRYSEPFSSYPVFHGDIDFTGLDLLQATRTFDFGEMNGILDGHIHGLRLFGSTPSAFTAAVATRPEGKRNISVKALNNLSILSQGGISSALSRGIYQFIDFYRYRQLGFECALENDTFTLTGTALPDSQRFLVYGGLLPPRIDITTTTPTISFREMVNRLGRIQRTGN